MQKLEEKVWLTFGVAPSGTWRWIELLCKNSFPGSASVSRKDFERKFYILENILIIKDVIRYWLIWIRLWLSLTLAYVNAICTLSFKTFPKFPVHRTIPPHSPELIILLSLLPAESVSSSSPSRKLLLLCCSWNKFQKILACTLLHSKNIDVTDIDQLLSLPMLLTLRHPFLGTYSFL